MVDYYGNTWTAYGNAQIGSSSPWKTGEKQFELDGSGDYLKSTAVTPNGNDFTLRFKVRMDNTGTMNELASGANDRSFRLNVNPDGDGKMRLLVGSNGTSWNLGTVYGTKTNWVSGQWYDIEMTFSTSAGYKVYVDGVQDISVSSTTKMYTPGGIVLGSQYSGSNTMDGAISDVYFNNTARLHTANFTPDTQSAVVSTLTHAVDWTGSTVENILGGTNNDRLTGNSADNLITGGTGNDSITGGTGNDTLSGGAGNDVYSFAEGDGVDLITENDATSGNLDKILFNGSVSLSEVALFIDGNGNLQIGNTSAAGDLITVQDYNDGAAYQIERLELSTGQYMTAAEVNQVIADMAAYATTNSVSFTSLDDVKNDANLIAIVNGGWHS